MRRRDARRDGAALEFQQDFPLEIPVQPFLKIATMEVADRNTRSQPEKNKASVIKENRHDELPKMCPMHDYMMAHHHSDVNKFCG